MNINRHKNIKYIITGDGKALLDKVLVPCDTFVVPLFVNTPEARKFEVVGSYYHRQRINYLNKTIILQDRSAPFVFTYKPSKYPRPRRLVVSKVEENFSKAIGKITVKKHPLEVYSCFIRRSRIRIQETTRFIGTDSFRLSKISSLVFPPSVEAIGRRAFYDTLSHLKGSRASRESNPGHLLRHRLLVFRFFQL